MSEIFRDYDEKFIATNHLYGKTSNNYLYTSAGYEEDTKITKDDLLRMLDLGVTLIYDGTTYCKPVFWKDSSGALAVTFATALGSSSTTALTLYSKEHSD